MSPWGDYAMSRQIQRRQPQTNDKQILSRVLCRISVSSFGPFHWTPQQSYLGSYFGLTHTAVFEQPQCSPAATSLPPCPNLSPLIQGEYRKHTPDEYLINRKMQKKKYFRYFVQKYKPKLAVTKKCLVDVGTPPFFFFFFSSFFFLFFFFSLLLSFCSVPVPLWLFLAALHSSLLPLPLCQVYQRHQNHEDPMQCCVGVGGWVSSWRSWFRVLYGRFAQGRWSNS